MKTLFYLMVIVIFISCEKQEESELLLKTNDKAFFMECNRVTNNSFVVNVPSDELQESDYEQINTRSLGVVSFSNNNQNIVIIPSSFTTDEQITGVAEQISNNTIKYNLESGLFAGGRFVVWEENGHFEFEFTIFGSGVPIIGSSRGLLLTSDNTD